MLNIITKDNLEEIVKESTKPVFVDMYADWCNPCKMISPIIDELTNEYGDKVEFIKVNIEENPLSTAAYGIRSIPALLVFNEGKLVKTHFGAMPKARIVELFQNYLI